LVLYYNLKVQGPIGYIKHLIGPMPAIAFLMLPLNIVEQFTRPLSLALRLYGSVYGEEMVVASLAALCPLVLPLTMQVMGILFGAIQAFVFTLLASIYLEEATAVHH
jgi:F-type H+-transporting ATPase subunit a